MTKGDKLSQVKSGFRLAGMMLLFILVAGLFFGGMDYVFFPAEHSRVVGFLFLVISIPIMVATMTRWVKVLAGLFALAVINGLLTIASGHLMGNPALPISRLDGFCITAFFGACAGLASTLRKRTITLVDRTLVLAFLVSFAFLLANEGARVTLTATDVALMVVCLCCLLAAWAIDQWHHRNAGSRRHSHAHSQFII
jgi:hypothetical protein